LRHFETIFSAIISYVATWSYILAKRHEQREKGQLKGSNEERKKWR